MNIIWSQRRMTMKSKIISTLRRISSALTSGALAVMLALTASASESVNQNVKVSQDGVYAIELQYVDSSGDSFPIQSGSAFFINDSDLLTCEHVVSMDSDTEAAVRNNLCFKLKEFIFNSILRNYILRNILKVIGFPFYLQRFIKISIVSRIVINGYIYLFYMNWN